MSAVGLENLHLENLLENLQLGAVMLENLHLEKLLEILQMGASRNSRQIWYVGLAKRARGPVTKK
jgi:hypothetical protein